MAVNPCPYCQNPVQENAPECPQCGIDGDKLTRIMGPMPVIFGGLSQSGTLLGAREVKGLVKVIDRYQRRFPQSRLHFLLRQFPQEMDFKVVLFWLFNHAGLSSQGSKDGSNRDAVIVIDPSRGKAGLIVGYGLEPLLSQKAMDAVVLSGKKELVALCRRLSAYLLSFRLRKWTIIRTLCFGALAWWSDHQGGGVIAQFLHPGALRSG